MTTARRVGGVLAGVLVAIFLVWGVAGGWAEAADYDWELDPLGLLLAVVVLSLFNLAWAAGYVALLESLAGRRLARLRFASVWARSLLGRYVPGNVLMFAGRAVLGREAGVPARISLGASVYEQVAMLAAAAFGSLAFLLIWQGEEVPLLHWAAVLVPLGLLLLDPAVFGPLAARLLRRAGREPLIPLERARVGLTVAWFALTMLLLALGIGLGVRAVAGSDSGSVAFIGLGFLLAWVVSMLAFFFPSGLGVREAVFAAVLARHVPVAAAVSLAAASRLLFTAVELAVVATLVAIGRREGRERRSMRSWRAWVRS